MSDNQTNPELTPRLRAGDRDRNQALEQLEWAFRDGQLDFEELHERTVAAQNAKFADELPALLNDLTLESTPASQPDVQPKSHLSQQFMPSSPTGAKKLSLIAFGGVDRKGPWKCSPQHTALTAFGGMDIDLTQAELTAQHTVIDVYCVFGGVDIIVPDTWQVDLDVLPIFGGAEVVRDRRGLDRFLGKKSDSYGDPALNSQAAYAAGTQPHITVRGFCAFGGVTVKRVRLNH